MVSTNGRVGRFTALALATGTLLAAGTTAHAATTTAVRPLQVVGSSSGSVLRLEINLPAAVPLLPGLTSRHLVQEIAVTDGTADTSSSVATLGSHAALGEGFLTDLLKAAPVDAFPETNASLSKPHDSKALVDQKAAGATIGAIQSLSEVAPKVGSTTTGMLAHSHSDVANVKLDMGASLLSLLTPALAPVTDVVGTVAAPVTSTVTTTVGNTLDTLNNTLASTPASDTVVTEQLTQATDTIKNTLAGLQNLPTVLANLTSTDTSLVNVQKLTSDHALNRVGGVVTATATNALSNVSLLGGLITINALQSGVAAHTSGTAGSADATSLFPASGQIVKVSVKGVADLILDKTGVHLAGLPDTLPVGTVTDAVNGAVTQLLSTASLLGISTPTDGGFTKTFNADKSGVTASASGAGLIISPDALTSTDASGKKVPFLRMDFVTSNAAVNARPITLAKTVVTRSVKVNDLPRDLPHTGANLPVTGAVATGLLGLGLLARRRRQARI